MKHRRATGPQCQSRRSLCAAALRAGGFLLCCVLPALLLTGGLHAGGGGAGYRQLQIAEPQDESAFWSGAGEVTIRVDVQPQLRAREGHEIRVFLDGEPAGKGARVNLTNVDRGTHEVYAEIVDRTGTSLIESPVIRFTLHRPSALLPP